MDRMACVDLSEFPLQLLLVRRPDWRTHPAVVVDRETAQGLILWANDRARERRVLPGMRYAAALSLARRLRAGVVSDSEIKANVSTLAGLLRSFPSDVEPSRYEPGVFWLGASGLSRLYPSLHQWARLIHSHLTDAGFYASVTVGFSRFGTYAAAKNIRERGGVLVFENPEEEAAHAKKAAIDAWTIYGVWYERIMAFAKANIVW